MRTVPSRSGYGETFGRLLDAIGRRGLTVVAQIDHAAAAREAGIELDNEIVVVFGNPRVGTPLMQDDARVGIELPLRMLVWEGANKTTVGYTDPRDLLQVFDVAPHAETLDAMASLLDELAHEAAADADPA